MAKDIFVTICDFTILNFMQIENGFEDKKLAYDKLFNIYSINNKEKIFSSEDEDKIKRFLFIMKKEKNYENLFWAARDLLFIEYKLLNDYKLLNELNKIFYNEFLKHYVNHKVRNKEQVAKENFKLNKEIIKKIRL